MISRIASVTFRACRNKAKARVKKSLWNRFQTEKQSNGDETYQVDQEDQQDQSGLERQIRTYTETTLYNYHTWQRSHFASMCSKPGKVKAVLASRPDNPGGPAGPGGPEGPGGPGTPTEDSPAAR